MVAPVKHYFESMTNIPQLGDNWGDLTTMLDAVLANGFNPHVITALTRVDTTVTAQCAGHGYFVNQVVAIAGVDQPEYNGEYAITGITTDTFTYEIAGSPVTPATAAGTIDVIAAPCGYDILFSSTNRRCYRSREVSSNRKILIVDNNIPAGYGATYAKFGRVVVADDVSDVDTIVGPQAPYDPVFPNKSFGVTGSGTSIIAGWFKWFYSAQMAGGGLTAASVAGNRHWTIIGDNMAFWFFCQAVAPTLGWNPIKAGYAFGEWPSLKAADAYNTVLIATDHYLPASSGLYHAYYNYFPKHENYQGKVVLRDFTGIGNPTSVAPFGVSGMANQVSGFAHSVDNIPFPNGPNGSFLVFPVYEREKGNSSGTGPDSGPIRGFWPGLYHTPHNKPFSDRAIVENVPGLGGRRLMCIEVSESSNNGTGANSNPRVFVDMDGPWR